MGKMTLDEAIRHAEEVSKSECSECSLEHKQLAEWLIELKEFRQDTGRMGYMRIYSFLSNCLDSGAIGALGIDEKTAQEYDEKSKKYFEEEFDKWFKGT
ncbi:hypothetical protein PM10SUCC1_32130 [Propionigenium maris DSM 9537]|uniref:Uncharacterized protein n=1 Tax=Propionigenium maris DSM 9537 TaxID=1123000 RepID=A0A9W6GMA4_9FUSO|nr:hypothetical protein [Propionigenium maris]GLI57699.1 hypothetical protein PM10SUCC1_32130 [Propionigenium maris DSM 9537]